MAEEKRVRRKRPEGAASGGFQLAGFPKEFTKSIRDDLDVRYIAILGASMLFALLFIVYQNFADHSLSDEQLEAIRAEALRKLYAVEMIQEDIVIEDEGPGEEVLEVAEEAAPTEREQRRQADMSRQAEVRGPSAAERAAARSAAAQRRAAAQRAAEAQVASQGVLGLLTAGGGGGEGEAVVDILGEDAGGSGTGSLSDVMTGVGGLAVAESQGQRTRTAKGGGRVSSGAGIDDLVEGIGTAQTAQLGRKGTIAIAAPAEVRGKGSKAANRNADVITKVIRSHQGAIDFCYQKEAKLNPNLKGEITISFSITPDGRTRSVKVVRNTLNSSEIERCIVQKVRGWRDFPKIDRSEGNVTVSQKYAFGS
jgi:hypothetical protein